MILMKYYSFGMLFPTIPLLGMKTNALVFPTRGRKVELSQKNGLIQSHQNLILLIFFLILVSYENDLNEIIFFFDALSNHIVVWGQIAIGVKSPIRHLFFFGAYI